MNRTELFDKVLKQIYDNPDSFWIIPTWCEREFGITDRNLIESIVDEMIERDWVLPKNHSKYSVMIKYNGQQVYEKYGSYSSFEKSINKANSRTKAEKNIKIILSIIGGIGVIYGCVFTYLNYQKDKKIDNQQSEIKALEKTIDSLQTELKKRHTTMYNRNYGGFDCVRIHSELLTSVLNRKSLTLIP
ncbi:hypothetical protein DFR65_1261 [Oceanihabitans sediminis]|uniref:Uncharacterized protein n=1 Tax=Oceanihabitans sediminis TaxID=1812012 RepID=A0A368P3K4_9FLAO|nr:hypothetical protein [Oceanihabitans sediminis]RBP25586.1 hypothetical protein DFR65_1261 [Oceanihabitans sediminis]RCU56349.1 hypothetical protein DU428_13330 [Oceanihabitans sediminis]